MSGASSSPQTFRHIATLISNLINYRLLASNIYKAKFEHTSLSKPYSNYSAADISGNEALTRPTKQLQSPGDEVDSSSTWDQLVPRRISRDKKGLSLNLPSGSDFRQSPFNRRRMRPNSLVARFGQLQRLNRPTSLGGNNLCLARCPRLLKDISISCSDVLVALLYLQDCKTAGLIP